MQIWSWSREGSGGRENVGDSKPRRIQILIASYINFPVVNTCMQNLKGISHAELDEPANQILFEFSMIGLINSLNKNHVIGF